MRRTVLCSFDKHQQVRDPDQFFSFFFLVLVLEPFRISVHKAKTEMTMCANVTEECNDRWGGERKKPTCETGIFCDPAQCSQVSGM